MSVRLVAVHLTGVRSVTTEQMLMELTFRGTMARINTHELVKRALTELGGIDIILTPTQQAKIQQDQMKADILEVCASRRKLIIHAGVIP